MSDWHERLRSRGYRLTPQRELVLQAVDTLGHATPDQVFEKVRQHSESINLSTVYRTLELLNDLGLISHAHLSDRAPTYHSRSATGAHAHFHLVCRGCGEVTSMDVEVLAPLLRRLREGPGFTADVGHLTVFGTCRSCG